MKKIALTLIVLVILGNASFAMKPAVVGGIRKGLGIGIYGREQLEGNLRLHTGLELNTSSTPITGILGLNWYLDTIAKRYPLLLNTSLVIYAGNKTEAGVSLSFVFEKLADLKNLFLEAGVDVTSSGGYLVLQVGYKL